MFVSSESKNERQPTQWLHSCSSPPSLLHHALGCNSCFSILCYTHHRHLAPYTHLFSPKLQEQTDTHTLTSPASQTSTDTSSRRRCAQPRLISDAERSSSFPSFPWLSRFELPLPRNPMCATIDDVCPPACHPIPSVSPFRVSRLPRELQPSAVMHQPPTKPRPRSSPVR